MRIAVWAALGAALVAPAGGLGAMAGVQDDKLTPAPLDQIDARIAKIKESGARFTRVDLLWSEVAPTKPANPLDPADPAYNFARADKIVTSLSQQGITPLICVYSSPTWANGNKRTPAGQQWNPANPDAVQFGQFMGALAKRYSGTFVPGLYAPPLPRVRHFEIWNEPNLQFYFRPQYSGKKAVAASNYVRLVRAAYPQIKAADPAAIVIAGSGGPKSSSDTTGRGTMDWLKAIVKTKVKIDAYSQHIYPAAAPTDNRTKAMPSWNSITPLLKTLDKLKRGLPLYITEAGYTTGTTRFRKVKVSFAQQNTYLKQIFALKQTKQKRVPVIVWFNLQDNSLWPGGLLRTNGAKKPSYASFRAIARRGSLSAALRP